MLSLIHCGTRLQKGTRTRKQRSLEAFSSSSSSSPSCSCCYLETESHCVAQIGLELAGIPLPQLLSAEIPGVHHYAGFAVLLLCLQALSCCSSQFFALHVIYEVLFLKFISTSYLLLLCEINVFMSQCVGSSSLST